MAGQLREQGRILALRMQELEDKLNQTLTQLCQLQGAIQSVKAVLDGIIAELRDLGEGEEVEVEKEIAEGCPPVDLRGGVIHEDAASVEDVEEIAENLGSNTNNVDLIIQSENIRSSRRSSYVMLIFLNI